MVVVVAASSGERASLLAAVMSIGSDLDLQTVLRRIIEAAVTLVNARYGALGVTGERSERLVPTQFVTVGFDEATVARIGALPQGHGILGVLIRDPQPLRLERLSAHAAAFGFPANHPPMSSFLGVPSGCAGRCSATSTSPRSGTGASTPRTRPRCWPSPPRPASRSRTPGCTNRQVVANGG